MMCFTNFVHCNLLITITVLGVTYLVLCMHKIFSKCGLFIGNFWQNCDGNFDEVQQNYRSKIHFVFQFTWLSHSFWRKISVRNSVRGLLIRSMFLSEIIFTDCQLVKKSIELNFDGLTVCLNISIKNCDGSAKKSILTNFFDGPFSANFCQNIDFTSKFLENLIKISVTIASFLIVTFSLNLIENTVLI